MKIQRKTVENTVYSRMQWYAQGSLLHLHLIKHATERFKLGQTNKAIKFRGDTKICRYWESRGSDLWEAEKIWTENSHGDANGHVHQGKNNRKQIHAI